MTTLVKGSKTATGVATGSVADTDAPEQKDAKRWWILAVLGIAQLMVVLDTTVVNIALPSAQRDLGFGNTDRQWVVTAYALAFGSLLLLGGRLADLFGRKRLFIVGLVGFAAASAVGGAAVNFTMLVSARAVQGVFGAMLAPAALSLLATTFKGKERGRAYGIYGAIGGGGAAVGLLLGGVLTEYLSWRWCMYVNLAFAALAFVGGLVLLHDREQAERPKLDLPGILLVSTGLFGIVYGFSHAETGGWLDAVTLSCLAAGVVLLVVFVFSQRRVANPVLPLRVVLDRNRGGSYLAILSLGIGLFGMFLFLTYYYLQGTLHFSAVQSGLAFLPMTAALVVTSQLAVNVLARRVGPRYIIAPGLAICALGLVLLTNLGLGSTYVADVLPATIVFGLGAGLVFSAATSRATAGVDAEDAGVASALVNTGQQIGGSVGTALLSTLAASAASSYLSSHPAGPNTVALATMHSYTTAFGWSAVVIGIGAVLTAVVLRGEVPEIDENAPEVVAV